MPHSPTPGTYSKQQLQTSTDNLGNRKRKGGSNDELPHPPTPRLDSTLPWPVKRSRGFTDEYVKPTTTSSRNAAPLTTHETEKSALTDATLSPGARVTYGSHPRAAGTHDSDSPTDASSRKPDTKKCIQVGRDTYALTSQLGTSYTFDRGIDTGTFQGQRFQPVTDPVCDDYDSIVVIDSSEPPNNLVGRETIALMNWSVCQTNSLPLYLEDMSNNRLHRQFRLCKFLSCIVNKISQCSQFATNNQPGSQYRLHYALRTCQRHSKHIPLLIPLLLQVLWSPQDISDKLQM